MINKQNKKTVKYIAVFILMICIIILSVKSSIIREVLYLLFISFAIAYTLNPIKKNLCENGLGKRTASIILICGLIIFVIAIFAFLIPSILKESLSINSAFTNMEKLISRFYLSLKPISNNKTMYLIIENMNNKINTSIVGVFAKIFDSLLELGQDILSIAVIPIIVYYFLCDGDYIGNKALNFFPVKSRNMIKKISYDVDKILGRYIVSQLLLCLIIGIVTFFILILLRIDFPIILSILNAFFNIIPYFGPIFGALPAVFIALIRSPQAALYTMISIYALQQIEGNILSPKITGDSVSMHPLTVIVLLIIGGKIAGFVGMVIAIPLGVVVKVVYEDLNYYLF